MSSSAEASSRLLVDINRKPQFIYGTAWKKDQTKELVKLALAKGFRKVDTAAQPRHYQENLVGAALREAFAEGKIERMDIYLQTKYTTPAGQDPKNMPYDASAPLDVQIHTSIASSLKNLRLSDDPEADSYIDCLLLHSPLPTREQTLHAWNVIESYVPHKIRALGISNVSLPMLRDIYEQSTVKPSVVQNRFYPQTQYDVPLRAFCGQHGISYQSFWTLTGNPRLLRSEAVAAVAASAQVTPYVALYALVMDLGVVVLNGTTSAEHMEEDLAGVGKVRAWALAHEEEWLRIGGMFGKYLDSTAS